MSNFFSRFNSAPGETPKDGIYTDKPLVEPEAVKFEPHQNDEVIELPEDFDYEGFEVVRREFFSHMYEPSITFNKMKINVNQACINRFPNVEYVNCLVDKNAKIFALEPGYESQKTSIRWCMESKGKRKPRQVGCKDLFAMISNLMGWNPDYRYKLLGRLLHANGKYLIAFDLSATEVYQKTLVDGEKPKYSRSPVYPAEWQGQFGVPYKEHQKTIEINVFEDFAVYGISEKNTRKQIGNEVETASEETNEGGVASEQPTNNSY